MKFLLATFFALAAFLSASGQADTSGSQSAAGSNPVIFHTKSSTSSRPKGISYQKEFSLGGKVSTSGWGIFGDFTKNINADKSRTLYFEIQFFKNQKETKKINEFTLSSFGYDSPKPFIYGKQNSFFAAKAGYGNKILIGEKAEKSGFEIKFDYTVGPSLGFLKPYYLNVFYVDNDQVYLRTEKYSEENAGVFLDATSIYGSAGFSKGFNEISLIPGAFGRAGLKFDWATYDDFVKSMEAGIGADLYIKRVPMMILENNKPYFVYLYLSLQLGKKW